MESQTVERGKQAKQARMEVSMVTDCLTESPIRDDPSNFLGLSNFDGFNEPVSSLADDQLFSSFSFSCLNSPFGTCGSLASPGGPEEAQDSVLQNEGTSGDDFAVGERFEAQKTSMQSGSCPNTEGEVRLDIVSVRSDSAEIPENGTASIIQKSIGGITLSERMLMALSLLKEFAGGGILAQVWAPVMQGHNYVLSTYEQPFLLDQVFAGFREISRGFTFPTKDAPGLLPGLPGRVFISGLPEWTSNVIYYNKLEYLRADYAVSHEVRGSLAVPVFDPQLSSCCAVLELVTKKEKLDFDVEMENICQALQVVDLKTAKAHVLHQKPTNNQRFASAEILDVLRAACHAHMLPLALTWVPIARSSGIIRDGSGSYIQKENVLCIQESACYVNDSRMLGFLRACCEHYLVKGQGVVGKALLSNYPFFYADVREYDILEYPLAHHARKFNLQAAVAIRLRSTYTGDDDYILEFFLPVNCKGSAEQQLLLNNLLITMRNLCRTLRTVLDAEAAEVDAKGHDTQKRENENFRSNNVEVADVPSKGQKMEFTDQSNNGSFNRIEKKRSLTENHISLCVLQKYFAGSLKDAAKNLGVCPTTLKRICRLHGISRWPSRKIKKVNHSLKKIQSVIDSVQGVEGKLKCDPATGHLLAAVTPEKLTIVTSASGKDFPFPSSRGCQAGKFAENLESNVCDSEVHMNAGVDLSGAREHSHHSMSSMTDSSSGSASSFPTFKNRSNITASDSDKSVIFIVKATYRSDTVRFKFCPSMGCQHLYEEIGKRFRLSAETYQLKYMDDEAEWVILMTDSDLLECIEVLESIDSHTMRLQIRDLPVDVQCWKQ
ncbi:Protein NLP2 [Apostasia shenzhenica]|uniref:Protein NLP2 n=1 Tax=Apostasia shenzhenica TaxID=1088818 RepID=A0A2I0AL08_9ASPA|nr:Protein NLP2 [Apostasia shenzhenica]